MSVRIGTRLGGYEIVAPLGVGGMGEVYRARDSKLERQVAIKVLPEATAREPSALTRFRREALAVAALSHPNILAIFDLGEEDGIAFAVTELLEGGTLRDTLRPGPLPPRKAVELAVQITKGLAAAHEKGVVHRDLKPENLFITKQGHLKILDFGLAKQASRPMGSDGTSAPTEPNLTEPGTVVGTVAYMSPEQARGLAVDARSDIFSFGAVLYEMLAGRQAFRRQTASDTIAAILREEPQALTSSAPDVPPALERIVRHCLEKTPSERFQSARDVEFALQELAASGEARPVMPAPGSRRKVLVAMAIGAVLALGGLAAVLSRPKTTGAVVSESPRIAVLPFENQGDAADDYFADGIADAVRGKLTALPGIQVIARVSSTAYRKTEKSLPQIAAELQARYLLTATVRWEKGSSGSRVLVSPELVEVAGSGAPVTRWQQPFDAQLTGVFQVQSDISTRVAQALGVALGSRDGQRIGEAPTRNLDAYDAFLRGEEASSGLTTSDPGALRRALAFYEQAVALDPAFAVAWARLARTSATLYDEGVPLPQLAERARTAAERGMALAPDRAESYMALGVYKNRILDDTAGALETYLQGQRMAPSSPEMHAVIATAERMLGRWEDAVERFRQAERLDPRSVLVLERLAYTLVRLCRQREAREVIERGLAIAPTNLRLLHYKTMTFLTEGNLEGAKQVVASAAPRVEPGPLVAYFSRSHDLVWVLDADQQELLLRLTPSAFDDDAGVWALCLAQAHALRGETAEVRRRAADAVKAFEENLRASSRHAERHALLGLALAYLGKKDEAVREAELGLQLAPKAPAAGFRFYIQYLLVRVHILTGEPAKALDALELLQRTPNVLTPGWLSLDPNFEALRAHPRFREVLASRR